MSYEIIYGKQFISLPSIGQFIPMILTGSNNTYEIAPGGGNGRRSRDWLNFKYYNGSPSLSVKPEQLFANLDADLKYTIDRAMKSEYKSAHETPEHVTAHFGWYASLAISGGHTSDLTWKRWRGLFERGVKEAKTIEELHYLGVHPRFGHYPRKDDSAPDEVSVFTEERYFQELARWETWRDQDHKNRSFHLTFDPADTDVVLARLHKAAPKKEREAKVMIVQNHFFVLVNDSGSLVRYTAHGFKYSYRDEGGKPFRTRAEAEKYRNHLVKERRHMAESWTVRQVNRQATFEVPPGVLPVPQPALY